MIVRSASSLQKRLRPDLRSLPQLTFFVHPSSLSESNQSLSIPGRYHSSCPSKSTHTCKLPSHACFVEMCYVRSSSSTMSASKYAALSNSYPGFVLNAFTYSTDYVE